MFVRPCRDYIASLNLYAKLCSFGHAVDLLGILFYMHALMFVLWLYCEVNFICLYLCTLSHAVGLVGNLLYMHALKFVCPCVGSFDNLALYSCIMFICQCCGSIGNSAFYTCTYVRLVRL